MWLACALIILFSVGFVLPCMLDITTTPDSEFVLLSKGTVAYAGPPSELDEQAVLRGYLGMN